MMGERGKLRRKVYTRILNKEIWNDLVIGLSRIADEHLTQNFKVFTDKRGTYFILQKDQISLSMQPNSRFTLHHLSS